MDCKTARQLLSFFHPTSPELEAGEADALCRHLADCPHCAALGRSEQTVDDHLGRAMRAVPVPDGLRDRLLGRLAAQRDGWYRRRVLRVAAVAAAICPVVGLGLFWAMSQRSAVNWQEVVKGTELPTSADDADQWFRQRQVETSAPRQFNYEWLIHCGMEDFQGKRVPVLVFARDQVQARVYILSDRQFDLSSLSDPLSFHGRWSIQVSPLSPRSRFAYVIYHRGGLLEHLEQRGLHGET